MEAKIEKISELSKLLSVKTRMSDDLFHLFGKFGIGHLLSRLSLEKQDRISASELILSLCLFRIVGESIHSICKHKIYELSKMGKTKYTVSGKKKNAAELIATYERERGKNCRKYKCQYIQLNGNLGDIPVRIFLIKYGRNSTWNVLLTTDTICLFISEL